MFNPEKPTLILLRGLPGSGKSSTASFITKLINTLFIFIPDGMLPKWAVDKLQLCACFEADHYFYDDEDNYNFDPARLKDAHATCQEETAGALRNGTPLVIVSNTTTAEWEVETYEKIAAENNATFISLIVENRHDGVSQHGGPEHTLLAMEKRFSVKL